MIVSADQIRTALERRRLSDCGRRALVDYLRAEGEQAERDIHRLVVDLGAHRRTGRTADAFETCAEIAAHERRLDV